MWIFDKLFNRKIEGKSSLDDLAENVVVNKETKLPMVWEFNQTQSWGDIVLGDYKFRNWRVALKELNYYLQETPLVPVNVSYTEENKIEDYFKK